MTQRISKPSVRRVAVQDLDELFARGPVLVLFTADWSAPDRKLDLVIDEVARRHAAKVSMVELDISITAHANFASSHGVDTVPTMMLFVGGRTVDRLVGTATTTAIEEWLLPKLTGATAIISSATRPSSVTILFLGANPSDQTKLALPREVEKIQTKLRGSDHRDVFRLEQHWEVQAKKLQGLILQHKPQILHFSGHGTSAGDLVFQDELGTSAPLSATILGDIFKVLGKHVRCVILNACFSRIQAAAIVAHVDAVVGVPRSIRDSDAIAFAEALYEAFGYGEHLGDAFDLACTAISIARENRANGERARDFGASATADRQTDSVLPELIPRAGLAASSIRFVGKLSGRS